jgi:hypothetical protein
VGSTELFSETSEGFRLPTKTAGSCRVDDFVEVDGAVGSAGIAGLGVVTEGGDVGAAGEVTRRSRIIWPVPLKSVGPLRNSDL